MKDYFTNLVERHQGLAETVTPRVRAHFELDSSPAIKEAGEVFHIPEQGSVRGQEDHDPGSWNRQKTAVTDAAPNQNTTKPGQVDPRSPQQSVISPVDEHASDSLHYSVPNTADTLEADLSVNAILERMQAQLRHNSPAEPAKNLEGVLQRPQSSKKDTESETARSRVVLNDGIDTPAVTASPDSSNQNSAVNEPADKSTPNRGELAIPDWLNQLQNNLVTGKTQTPENQERVVNVSIGRIEVRAVRESKPSAITNKTRPSGVMSLDEYLKNRQQKGVV